MSNELVKTHIRKWLAANVKAQDAFAAEIAKLEAAGHRMIYGGQRGAFSGGNEWSWTVTDWRTDDVLDTGKGTVKEFEARLSALDPGNKWFFVDSVKQGFGIARVAPTPGLPQALADVLIDWLEGDADAQDFAAWLGEPVDVIDEQMRDPDAKCLNG
ncbi:hypothetical protein [Streptomyces sp. NPDC058653]|uniref:hypothetical protein n=1 Tax=Streptomyces sp. NPDC058653 TaxID=3346576 RepID=UPI00365E855F